MENIFIVGRGGLAKEVVFLCSRSKDIKIQGFIDDVIDDAIDFMGFPILGDFSILNNLPCDTKIVIAVAEPKTKKDIYDRLSKINDFIFPSLIDRDAVIGINISIGKGNIIMANSTFTADIKIGDFNMINLATSIGHDTKVGSFNSFYPNVSVSGGINISDFVSIGTGARIIQNINIGKEVIVGAGAVVIDNIPSNSKVVGVPAKSIERRENDEE